MSDGKLWPWRTIAASTVVVILAGLTTFGVLALVDIQPGGRGAEEAQGAHGARPKAAICVDAIGVDAAQTITPGDDTITAVAEQRFEAALPALAAHPYYAAAGYGDATAIVDRGCPAGPAAALPGVDFHFGIASTKDIPLLAVDEPSFHKLFVFVLPSVADVDRLLGGTQRRVAEQEYVCSGDGHARRCFQVTYAIYVAAEELNETSDSLAALLAQGLGLSEIGEWSN